MTQQTKGDRRKWHVCAPPRLLTDKVASSGILRSPPRPLNRFRQAARGELGLTRSLERANIGANLLSPRTQKKEPVQTLRRQGLGVRFLSLRPVCSESSAIECAAKSSPAGWSVGMLSIKKRDATQLVTRWLASWLLEQPLHNPTKENVTVKRFGLRNIHEPKEMCTLQRRRKEQRRRTSSFRE